VPSTISYSFGPGPVTPAVRGIIIANVAAFVVTLVIPSAIVATFGLEPASVLEHLHVWRLVTYLFIHSPTQFSHILFNMLAVWMFGVDLERRWGTRAFLKYYFIVGIGAGVSMILVSLLPFAATASTYHSITIGASGAVYGLLMAWALIFPNRQILFMLIFPLSARMYVLIMGAIAFLSAVGASGGPVANVAHLGGLVVGFLYLKGPTGLHMEFRYRLTKWRMERLRRKFNIHKGGRDDWEDRIH
jgi:membrane associated rhomboid family serine protease